MSDIHDIYVGWVSSCLLSVRDAKEMRMKLMQRSCRAGWIITLLATLGCFFTTVMAARLLSRPQGWSDIGEGQIVLPPDNEDDGDERDQHFQPVREKAEYVRGPSSI